ncbi:hypothetical protein BS78_01G506900 [Paspalum vaginatum]|nr:hypothetical protein BS78_01G506900 [Paspalum vaginatum]
MPPPFISWPAFMMNSVHIRFSVLETPLLWGWTWSGGCGGPLLRPFWIGMVQLVLMGFLAPGTGLPAWVWEHGDSWLDSWPWLFNAGAMPRSWPFTPLHRHVPFLSDFAHIAWSIGIPELLKFTRYMKLSGPSLVACRLGCMNAPALESVRTAVAKQSLWARVVRVGRDVPTARPEL